MRLLGTECAPQMPYLSAFESQVDALYSDIALKGSTVTFLPGR
jgi:hypothetical protein